MESEEIEFSDGFTELHTDSYKAILEGKGFPISVSKKAIEIVHEIRNGMK
jgi:UDP-N-acetyl-2-amino-2-deoxyglucuronate dehydrogenase